MIDYPQAQEIDTLIDIARATDFFRPQEIDVIHDLLRRYFDQVRELGDTVRDSGEYIWTVFREQPGSRPLGFACFGADEMGEDVWELYWIAVDPGYQNQRVGSALLKHAEEHVERHHARQFYIETSDTEQYAPTRAFYLKRGYEQVAHMTNYYRPGDGKVVYRRVYR